MYLNSLSINKTFYRNYCIHSLIINYTINQILERNDAVHICDGLLSDLSRKKITFAMK